MSDNDNDGRVDYVEFPAADLVAIKRFYGEVFGWKFTDFGPTYSSFGDGRLAGGFTTESPVGAGGALVVIYARDLEATYSKIGPGGGKIVREPFAFPGGRRFHFADPSGNELAVWSEQ